jgi:hypothetical protein
MTHRQPIRQFAALLVIAFLVTGCVTSFAVQGTTRPATLYFAAVEDYNIAKTSVLIFVEQPTTPLSEAEAILKVVKRADAEVRRVDTLRKNFNVTDRDYSTARTLLGIARAELVHRSGAGGLR